MELSKRPSLNRDAIRLLEIASQYCHSDTLSGLVIEITTVFLHSKTTGVVHPISPATDPIAPTPEAFEPLPEINLDGIDNLEFLP